MIRAVFMGSDAFSLPILKELAERGPELVPPVDTVAVVTQPDRPAGRGRKVKAGPVKAYATDREISVVQPGPLRDREELDKVFALRPDLVVVASYGQILPARLLEAPKHGVLNLHPSLLPRYRGPSPIIAAILHGDQWTGATLMRLVKRMDAGPIIDRVETEVEPDETAGALEAKLSHLSADLLLRDLPGWIADRLRAFEQDESFATYCSLVRKEDALIDWTQPAEQLARAVRAYNPWPAAYTSWGGKRLQILRASAAPGIVPPGRVAGLHVDSLTIGTGGGILLARELRLSGGRPLGAADLVRGHRDLIGATLG